jgi:hypothetical protein
MNISVIRCRVGKAKTPEQRKGNNQLIRLCRRVAEVTGFECQLQTPRGLMVFACRKGRSQKAKVAA